MNVSRIALLIFLGRMKKKNQKPKAHIPENTEATPIFILLQNLIFSGG